MDYRPLIPGIGVWFNASATYATTSIDTNQAGTDVSAGIGSTINQASPTGKYWVEFFCTVSVTTPNTGIICGPVFSQTGPIPAATNALNAGDVQGGEWRVDFTTGGFWANCSGGLVLDTVAGTFGVHDSGGAAITITTPVSIPFYIYLGFRSGNVGTHCQIGTYGYSIGVVHV